MYNNPRTSRFLRARQTANPPEASPSLASDPDADAATGQQPASTLSTDAPPSSAAPMAAIICAVVLVSAIFGLVAFFVLRRYKSYSAHQKLVSSVVMPFASQQRSTTNTSEVGTTDPVWISSLTHLSQDGTARAKILEEESTVDTEARSHVAAPATTLNRNATYMTGSTWRATTLVAPSISLTEDTLVEPLSRRTTRPRIKQVERAVRVPAIAVVREESDLLSRSEREKWLDRYRALEEGLPSPLDAPPTTPTKIPPLPPLSPIPPIGPEWAPLPKSRPSSS
ncbi:hypothetical protein BKA62DRAFT_676156 [Auriculariales sp. MPI-PUGE-AT-0066]|nr:hypothetical protein BKA62DRAFT_676156 [Auriculariales sp. MPI-PUGE-AT-0066]